MSERVLTLRELNRTLLARQLLLERRKLPVATAAERVGALQAQWPPSPYVALWSRLASFRKDQLMRALENRRVVKATLMRTTLHIVSTRDYAAFAPMLEEQWLANIGGRFPPERAAVHLREVAERAPAFTSTPRTRAEIFDFFGAWLRDAGPGLWWRLWAVVQARAAIVHAPPSAAWRTAGTPTFISARAWADGAPRRSQPDPTRLVRRYLAAFGPATRGDVASWTGLAGSRLKPGFDALEPELRSFSDEAGRSLLDLRRAPLTPAETPAPIRFLPKWDSSLLAYQPPERVRILPEAYRTGVIQKNGDVAQTFLVDGFVAGTWRVEKTKQRATLVAEAFEPLPRAAARELAAEAEALARFVEPDAASYATRVA